MDKVKLGVLLINLGTPDDVSKKSIKRYLKQFLDDVRVIDLPWWIRKPLLHLFILPFRPAKTAKAYAAIWDDKKGSPLLFHSIDLVNKLQRHLGENYQVEVGMRYGNPSIHHALEKLLASKCQHITVLPLFVQYSSAATGSALENLMQVLNTKWNIPALTIQTDFYRDPGYIEAKANLIRPFLEKNLNAKVLFSYHSLPLRHLNKSKGCEQICRQESACPALEGEHSFCYRAQCYETSRLLAQKLGLQEGDYTVAFQSRLGRTVWVGPDILQRMTALRQEGVKNLLVVCPSFVADCLETLEEIGLRAKAQWVALGGETFTLVPSLNADPLWTKTVANLVQRQSE